MGRISFTKAVGSGNDFMILDNRGDKLKSVIEDFSVFAKDVCRRKLSIGADGVLVLEDSKKADFKIRIFNPDGSEVTMCGNGARCSVIYAFKNGWCKENMRMETGAGILEAGVKRGSVKLKMTDPVGITLNRDIGIGKNLVKTHFVNTGVPHVVHFVEELEDYPVKEMGADIRYHTVFEPEGTNANFVQIAGGNRINVRTYERGVEDETLACGTGSVASAVIASLVYGMKSPVEVLTRSGEVLNIYFDTKNNKVSGVYLEGPAKLVYEGVFENV